MAATARRATIVIVTKNRKDELRGAIRSAMDQTADVEVLVVDDGSVDGTHEAVRKEFPSVQLHRSPSSKGYIVQRNIAAALAATPMIFSLDDDSVFASSRTVAQTLDEFNHARIGAVAIPFINVRRGPDVLTRAPDPDVLSVTCSYIGTAHALRRDLFLALGGYRSVLVHQGEERDYCLRMLDKGYVTRLGRADPIHHFESPKRNIRQIGVYTRRNDVLYAYWNVPMPYLPVHLLGTSFNGIVDGYRYQRLPLTVRGLLAGYWACLCEGRRREPVDRRVYELSRALASRGSATLAEIEGRLPPLEEIGQTPIGRAAHGEIGGELAAVRMEITRDGPEGSPSAAVSRCAGEEERSGAV